MSCVTLVTGNAIYNIIIIVNRAQNFTVIIRTLLPPLYPYTDKDGQDLSITMNAEPPPDYSDADKFPVSGKLCPAAAPINALQTCVSFVPGVKNDSM